MDALATAAKHPPYTPEDMATRPNTAGRETRDRIIEELATRRQAGQPWMTVRGLARALGMNHAGITRHVRNMAEDGEIILQTEDVTTGLRLMRVSLPDAR